MIPQKQARGVVLLKDGRLEPQGIRTKTFECSDWPDEWRRAIAGAPASPDACLKRTSVIVSLSQGGIKLSQTRLFGFFQMNGI